MKMIALLAAVCCLLRPCAAEEALYSIQDLAGADAPRWQQTYEAHGRRIEVDAEIRIPDVSAAPVLLAEAASPIAEPLHSQLTAAYQQAAERDPVSSYSFRSIPFRTSVVHAFPPLWGKTRESAFISGAMGQRAFDLRKYDANAAYAENNPLTVSEAAAIAQSRAAQLFPHERLDLRNAVVWERSRWKETGEAISQQGYYDLQFSQTFHGIPFMACIQSAYSQMGTEDIWLRFRGYMNASVVHADAWSFHCCFYRELETLHRDIPLLPFEAVKAKVEALILSGHIRSIEEVGLGYVQFDTEDPSRQALVPAWVIWCEYHRDGPQSERTASINDSGLMYRNSDFFRPVILHAQTGELFDPENEAAGRCLCPAILPW